MAWEKQSREVYAIGDTCGWVQGLAEEDTRVGCDRVMRRRYERCKVVVAVVVRVVPQKTRR